MTKQRQGSGIFGLNSKLQVWRKPGSARVIIGFLVTFLTKALLPQLLSLARWPALGRVPVVPNFFHLRIMEATVLFGTFSSAEIVLLPSPDLCLDTIQSLSFEGSFFDLMAWSCSDMHCQL